MLLAEMKSDVTKFAEVISKILEVDVLIVDSNLKTISNTYSFPDKPMPIRQTSIIGQVIATGKTISIADKSYCDTCRECIDFKSCEMKGFISVPIFYKKRVVGAISLIVPSNKIHIVFGNVGNSVEFLVKMAELLSSKIQNSDDYDNLSLIKREREVIMDSIDYAMVSMDEIGYITYYNKRFISYLGLKEDCCGMFIRDVIPNKYITEYLSNYIEFYDRLVFFEKDNCSVYGFLSCMSISLNGSRSGMLFILKSIQEINTQLTEIGYSNASVTFKAIENNTIPIETIDEAKRLSVTSKTVLISGEKGTDKDLLAKAIYSFSDRLSHYFITVDCEGAYGDILDKSLFGNEESDNIVSSTGKLLLANKGTIYFSSIEQMPIYLQRRLAEILKTKTINTAFNHDFKVDLRMIFSTSEDLECLVRDGRFDDELYYRISKDIIEVPPLRKDKSLLKKLIFRTAEFYKEKYNKKSLIIDKRVFEELLEYDWPGNGRELDKVMDCIICRGRYHVTIKDLIGLNIIGTAESKPLPIRDQERDSISQLLASKLNRDDVAKLLGISRATLYRKIKKYNL
jgi:sigma-54 dependent transcriptional regulator, acetoin dehydrogenase operon transcriptional activator AcoR